MFGESDGKFFFFVFFLGYVGFFYFYCVEGVEVLGEDRAYRIYCYYLR